MSKERQQKFNFKKDFFLITQKIHEYIADLLDELFQIVFDDINK